jgi:hypothetical protein
MSELTDRQLAEQIADKYFGSELMLTATKAPEDYGKEIRKRALEEAAKVGAIFDTEIGRQIRALAAKENQNGYSAD